MSFAEIVLRIGSGLGGWIILIAHALVIAVVPRADCDPASDELWVGTLVLATVSAGGVVLLGLGLRWRDSLRWFALLALPLAVYAVVGITPAIVETTLGGHALCGIAGALPAGVELTAFPATGPQRAWPLVQIAVLSAGVVQGARYWVGSGGR